MADARIEIATQDGVAHLQLNRPEKRNALDQKAWLQLLEAMCSARDSAEVRAILVSGEGGNFCAGTDLGEMSGGSAGSGEMSGGSAGSAEPHPSYRLVELLAALDKPLIAAVDGVAVGFGLTFLLHCDFVYVTPGAKLRAPFVALGVVPEAASSYLAPLLLGPRNAAELLLGTEFVAGERAALLGLATACVPAERLLPTALDRARALAALPPNALQTTKRLLVGARREPIRSAQRREEEAFSALLGSPENMEAMRAYLEKRAPDFASLQGVPPAHTGTK